MSETSPLDTLFVPFEQAILAWPEKTLFLGAQYHAALTEISHLDNWQSFKPFYDDLKRASLGVSDELPDDVYDAVFCLVPKQKEEACYWIAQGLSRLKDGGLLVLSAANDAFGSRLKKWAEEAGLQSIQSESKNKAKVVWGTKGAVNQSLLDGWIAAGQNRTHNFGDGMMLQTQPGIFSWDRIDPASQLLAQNFTPQLSGHVADFGCGYGYLSLMAFKNCPRVKKITLIEADKRALSFAEKNLDGHDIHPLWHDATKSLPPAMMFDHIIMNPPFHTAKKTDISLGQGFIVNAAKNLKKGGTLLVVSNVHLPYESVLQKTFDAYEMITQQGGFKVLKAVKK